MDTDLRFQLPEEGADAERIAVLSGYLRPEVLQLDVEDVRALPAGEPPRSRPLARLSRAIHFDRSARAAPPSQSWRSASKVAYCRVESLAWLRFRGT